MIKFHRPSTTTIEFSILGQICADHNMGRWLWTELGSEEGQKAFIMVSWMKIWCHWPAVICFQIFTNCSLEWHHPRPCLGSSVSTPSASFLKIMFNQCCNLCQWLRRNSIFRRGASIFLRSRSMEKRADFQPICSSRPTLAASYALAMSQVARPSTCDFLIQLAASSRSVSSLWMARTKCWSSNPS